MSHFEFVKAFYNKNERQNIINFIIDNNLYFELRGKSMWKNMEKLEICPGRTWQSLKQHFSSNLINSLDTISITATEKKRILDCYYKAYKYSPEKRKQFLEEKSEESKRKKTTEKHSNPVLVKDTVVSSNKRKKIEEEMAKNNVEEEPYSEEEDRNIIIYIKENMNWGELQYFDDIYESCQQQVLIKRSASSIKDRFLNNILPNIYKYNIVESDEIALFYDRAGVDIPPDLDQILDNYLRSNQTSSTENNLENSMCKNVEKYNLDTHKKASDNQDFRSALESAQLYEYLLKKQVSQGDSSHRIVEIQNNEDEEEDNFINLIETQVRYGSNFEQNPEGSIVEYNYLVNKDGVFTEKMFETDYLYSLKYVLNQLCLTINNEEHVFISETQDNRNTIMNKIIEEYNFSKENIHIISNQLYMDMEKVNELNTMLENKIFNFIDKSNTKKNNVLSHEVKSIPFDCKNLKQKQKGIVHLPIKGNCSESKLEHICKCTEHYRKKMSELKISDQNIKEGTEENSKNTNTSDTSSVLNNIDPDILDHSSPIITKLKRSQHNTNQCTSNKVELNNYVFEQTVEVTSSNDVNFKESNVVNNPASTHIDNKEISQKNQSLSMNIKEKDDINYENNVVSNESDGNENEISQKNTSFSVNVKEKDDINYEKNVDAEESDCMQSPSNNVVDSTMPPQTDDYEISQTSNSCSINIKEKENINYEKNADSKESDYMQSPFNNVVDSPVTNQTQDNEISQTSNSCSTNIKEKENTNYEKNADAEESDCMQSPSNNVVDSVMLTHIDDNEISQKNASFSVNIKEKDDINYEKNADAEESDCMQSPSNNVVDSVMLTQIDDNEISQKNASFSVDIKEKDSINYEKNILSPNKLIKDELDIDNVNSTSSKLSNYKNTSLELQNLNEMKQIENIDKEHKLQISEKVSENMQVNPFTKISISLNNLNINSEVSEGTSNTNPCTTNVFLSEKSKQLLKNKSITNPNFLQSDQDSCSRLNE